MNQKNHIDRFPVSVHLFFWKNDSVLMIRRHGTGFCDNLYSVPAGHVNQFESILGAAIREAQEEVSLIILPADLRVVGTMYRHSTEARIDFFLEVDRWTGVPVNNEAHKCSEIGWFPSSQLPDETIPYVRRALLKNTQRPWFEEYTSYEN